MLFTVGVDGTVLEVNRFGAESLGRTVAEVVGRPVADVFHPDDRAAAAAYFADTSCLACLSQQIFASSSEIVILEQRWTKKDLNTWTTRMSLHLFVARRSIRRQLLTFLSSSAFATLKVKL